MWIFEDRIFFIQECYGSQANNSALFSSISVSNKKQSN